MNDATQIVLSTQQEAIIEWFRNGRGNAVIEALAGTGKTFTGLLGIDAAPEKRILFAAFNTRIATEIKSKLRNKNAEAKTLHSLGYTYVRNNRRGCKPDAKRGFEDAQKATNNAPANVVKVVEKIASLLKGICPINPTQTDAENIALDFNCEPDEACEEMGWNLAKCAAAAITAMNIAKQPNAANTVTFDDMIFLPVVMGWAKPDYDLVVVDECQDMNKAQLLLCQKVVKRGGRIAIVGDENQAIYGFRGADSSSVSRMKRELNATCLPLTITRRCPKSVVALAQNLVPAYQAAPEAKDGTVTNIGKDEMFKNARPTDFILSRKNAPLAAIALRFLREGRAARIEGKDIGSGLISLIRKLAGKRPTTIEAFLEKLNKHQAKSEATIRAANGNNMEDRLMFVADQCETIRAIAEGRDSVASLITAIEALFAVNEKGESKPAIVCSTVHKAKGLEAHNVFVLTETLYPGGRHTQEEKNIEYVAYTRAISNLMLVA